MKTIITASVSHSTAVALNKVNKGNRSRVVDRAVSEYLEGEVKFNINDVETKRLAGVLHHRLMVKNNLKDTPLTLMLKELIEELQ